MWTPMKLSTKNLSRRFRTPNMIKHLQPNINEVAAKIIEGEAIFINLSTGVYYSLNQSGTLIWEIIEAERTLDEAVAAVTDHYQVSKEQAEVDVERLVSTLLEEKIVIESDKEPKSGQLMETKADRTERKPYVTPELHIYRDMGDLLALDPPLPGIKDIPWSDSSKGSPDNKDS